MEIEQKTDKPLVSMIILEYSNFQYLFECIESIMSQDYPNIELIVNGDCCDDFDETTLINFFRMHKRPNIKKIQINNNEFNIGTVRCCNQCVRVSSGKYYMLIAADEALYGDSVLSMYVRFYESAPGMALSSGAQTHYLGLPVLKRTNWGISLGNARYSRVARRSSLKDSVRLFFKRGPMTNMNLLGFKAKLALIIWCANLKLQILFIMKRARQIMHKMLMH